MKKFLHKIYQLIIVALSCFACMDYDTLPEPSAAPAMNNIYNPSPLQNAYSQWITPTWVQIGDTLKCKVKLMSDAAFNPNVDLLFIYCHELGTKQNLNLAYYKIFTMNSNKKARENFSSIEGTLKKTFYKFKNSYFLEFELINSKKTDLEINKLGIGFRWYIGNS
jgi:hypothetical protein